MLEWFKAFYLGVIHLTVERNPDIAQWGSECPFPLCRGLMKHNKQMMYFYCPDCGFQLTEEHYIHLHRQELYEEGKRHIMRKTYK